MTTVRHANDELAEFPPAREATRLHARVSSTPLHPEVISCLVRDPGAGAIVVFEAATCEVDPLEHEAYAEIVEEGLAAILADCAERHELLGAAAEHRLGTVPHGEPAIVVAVSAAHREEAFAAATEAIDAILAEARA